MNKIMCSILVVLGLISFSCGSSGTGTNADALEYATYGKTMSDAMSTGLKEGGANPSVSTLTTKTLTDTCLTEYTDCPYLTEENGGDSNTGEILLRLWSLDYNDNCTDALIASGRCFDCVDCDTGSVGTTNFIKPTMISNPTSCGTVETTEGLYVNFGVDPCFFDTIIGQIGNIKTCETVQGRGVDVSSAIPWFASWGIGDETGNINFSSYYSMATSSNGGGIWWTINAGNKGNQENFLSLNPNWLYYGNKDPETKRFMFLGTGSPAYFETEAKEDGFTAGVNISAYTGSTETATTEFEAIQIRVQSPHKYIERLKSNGDYLWYQKWSEHFPEKATDVEAIKNIPDDTRCVKIGNSNVVTSKYVPFSECVDSFSKESIDELNSDSNYTLKVIDGETASSIDFSSKLTPTTQTTCLEEEAEE